LNHDVVEAALLCAFYEKAVPFVGLVVKVQQSRMFLWRLAPSEQSQEKATACICLLTPRPAQSASLSPEFLSGKMVRHAPRPWT
jgi:hypothetical protein